MLTVKLTKGSSIDPQDTGLQPVANPPGWASKAVASLNLTMPLRARSPAGQGSEAVLGCEILNRMTALGRPVSYRIGR